MWKKGLLWVAIVATMSAYLMVKADDRVLTPLLCGANQACNVAGIYYGLMPKSNPASRRDDFRRILKEKNIYAIRFPGGTLATLYLAENLELMRRLPGREYASLPELDKKDWVTPWQFFDFCRDAAIEPIYQLNTLLFAENGVVYLLADAKSGGIQGNDFRWGGAQIILDTSKRAAAAKAVTTFVAKTIEKGFKVRHWELGNEEYGGPRIDPKDYADIAVRFTRAVHEADPTAKVWITLGDNQMRHPNSEFYKWSETLLLELKRSGMQKEKNWAFTLHYVNPGSMDAPAEMVRKYGLLPVLSVLFRP